MNNLEKVRPFIGMFHNNEELDNCVSICLQQFSVERGLKANDEITQSFSKLLTQREVEQRTVSSPFDAIAFVFEFQEGRLFCTDAMDSLRKVLLFIDMFHNNEELDNCVSICLQQFSVEKGLKADDKITFTKRPRQEGTRTCQRFKVEIKRKIRLFDHDIWGELMV
ncbi:hypothetical protein V6N13_062256 [Hibiscus sabdariffa]|uniref:Uncharacterized protein n=2 Tax=Hibiscus sabdariffa TaxID=183260 RepID=A0ABR2NJI0_9ROSI